LGPESDPSRVPPWDSGTASSGPQPVRACARPGRPRASSAAAKEEPVRAAPSPPRLATSGGSSSWGSSRRRRRPALCWVLRGAAPARSPLTTCHPRASLARSLVVRGLTGELPAARAGEGGDGAVLRPRPPPRPGRRLPRLLQGPAHAPALPPDHRARKRGKLTTRCHFL